MTQTERLLAEIDAAFERMRAELPRPWGVAYVATAYSDPAGWIEWNVSPDWSFPWDEVVLELGDRLVGVGGCDGVFCRALLRPGRPTCPLCGKEASDRSLWPLIAQREREESASYRRRCQRELPDAHRPPEWQTEGPFA